MMEVIRMPTIPNVEIPYPDLGMKDQFAKQPGMTTSQWCMAIGFGGSGFGGSVKDKGCASSNYQVDGMDAYRYSLLRDDGSPKSMSEIQDFVFFTYKDKNYMIYSTTNKSS